MEALQVHYINTSLKMLYIETCLVIDPPLTSSLLPPNLVTSSPITLKVATTALLLLPHENNISPILLSKALSESLVLS